MDKNGARRAKWRVLRNRAQKQGLQKGKRKRRAFLLNIRRLIQMSLKKLFIGWENDVNFRV